MKFALFVLALTSAAAVRENPVTKVVELITELKAKIEEDGKAEQKLYDKYACWCEKTTLKYSAKIEEEKEHIETLSTKIVKLKASLGSLSADIAQLSKEVAQTKAAIKEATGIRHKENADFVGAKTEMEQAIGALEKAINVLGKGTGLTLAQQETQILAVSADVKAALRYAAVVKIPQSKIDSVRSFLSSETSNYNVPYAPASTQIQGILKDMYDTFSANLETANSEEGTSEKNFQELMAAKNTELKMLEETLAKKTNAQAVATKDEADSQMDRDDTQSELADDEKFFEDTKDAGDILPWFTRLIPSYCLGEGILNMASRELFGAITGDKPGVFDMDVLGWNIVYMAIELPLFMGISLMLDHPSRAMGTQKLFHKPDEKPEPIENEDVDVMNERTEVESGAREDDLVLVKNLRKVYKGKNKDKVAVQNLSFGVHPGEVFGFLGTNGAGKTTTMSVLCGEQLPNMGRGFVGGFDVVDQATDARRVVGYCPQFDATMDLLNAEEHLHLYAGLRGIDTSVVDDVVNSLILKAGLTEHRKTLASNMSGGNRRKLSVAISLIRAPAVVILDEPSAGMDPMARRGLWEVIQAVAAKCAVVLTTHHLEEVEALSNRVAIMVDGSMRCIGSLQDLKHKYGSGFEMSIRVESEGRCAAMRKFMEENIPDAKEEEFRQQKFTFALPSDTKLSQTFRLVEHAKESLGVTDYSIAQTSLEQVFLRIGGDAEEPQQE